MRILILWNSQKITELYREAFVTSLRDIFFQQESGVLQNARKDKFACASDAMVGVLGCFACSIE